MEDDGLGQFSVRNKQKKGKGQKRKRQQQNKEAALNRKRKREASVNTSIYFTNVPKTISVDDFAEYISKAGVLKKHPDTRMVYCRLMIGQPLVKFYTDDDGNFKGDAIATYFKPDSLDLAFQLLHDFPIKPGQPPLQLDIATHPYNPAPSKKARVFDQEEELGWDEKENCTVVLKNMFVHDKIKSDPKFYKELKEEVTQTCMSLFGHVKTVKVFERNPEGVVSVKFTMPLSAQKCIDTLNGKTFDDNKIEASFYDGYTDFFTPESDKDRVLREQQWLAYLEAEGKKAQEENETSEKPTEKEGKPRATPENEPANEEGE